MTRLRNNSIFWYIVKCTYLYIYNNEKQKNYTQCIVVYQTESKSDINCARGRNLCLTCSKKEMKKNEFSLSRLTEFIEKCIEAVYQDSYKPNSVWNIQLSNSATLKDERRDCCIKVLCFFIFIFYFFILFFTL